MRYDAMRLKYPRIDELLAQVAEYTHGEAGPDLAYGWALSWIGRNIITVDREAVIAKVEQLIDAIKE